MSAPLKSRTRKWRHRGYGVRGDDLGEEIRFWPYCRSLMHTRVPKPVPRHRPGPCWRTHIHIQNHTSRTSLSPFCNRLCTDSPAKLGFPGRAFGLTCETRQTPTSQPWPEKSASYTYLGKTRYARVLGKPKSRDTQDPGVPKTLIHVGSPGILHVAIGTEGLRSTRDLPGQDRQIV